MLHFGSILDVLAFAGESWNIFWSVVDKGFLFIQKSVSIVPVQIAPFVFMAFVLMCVGIFITILFKILDIIF